MWRPCAFVPFNVVLADLCCLCRDCVDSAILESLEFVNIILAVALVNSSGYTVNSKYAFPTLHLVTLRPCHTCCKLCVYSSQAIQPQQFCQVYSEIYYCQLMLQHGLADSSQGPTDHLFWPSKNSSCVRKALLTYINGDTARQLKC